MCAALIQTRQYEYVLMQRDSKWLIMMFGRVLLKYSVLRQLIVAHHESLYTFFFISIEMR